MMQPSTAPSTRRRVRVLVTALLLAGLAVLTVVTAGGAATPAATPAAAEPYAGYTLFGPKYTTTTFLVNMNGEVVHTWPSDYQPGNGIYLTPDGSIMRAALIPSDYFNVGGAGGRFERIAWDGTLLWSYEYSSADVRAHHDITLMPNGNILAIAWERKTSAEAIQAGRNPSRLPDGELWPEHIIEIEPVGTNDANIVWEWHLWDHIVQDFDPTKDNYGVVADHPELVDINYGPPNDDWIHANGIDYNPELDQIVLSARDVGELWIIDHSTTTEEAAGHTGGNSGMGGDLLYRWGNPAAYDAGTWADQQLFNHHDTDWVPAGYPGAGNITVFNNGDQAYRPYSSVDEIAPPYDGYGNYVRDGAAFGPAAPSWSYADLDLFAWFVSGAQRLPNGNTLIVYGPFGYMREVSAAGATVWEYTNPYGDEDGDPNPMVFKAERYGPDYPGLRHLFDYNVVFMPLTATTIPPCGGPFAYEVTVTNNTTAATTFDAWLAVTQPNGNSIILDGPDTYTLGAGATQSATFTEYVPRWAAPGVYDVRVNLGNFAEIVDYDGVQIEKTGICVNESARH